MHQTGSLPAEPAITGRLRAVALTATTRAPRLRSRSLPRRPLTSRLPSEDHPGSEACRWICKGGIGAIYIALDAGCFREFPVLCRLLPPEPSPHPPPDELAFQVADGAGGID